MYNNIFVFMAAHLLSCFKCLNFTGGILFQLFIVKNKLLILPWMYISICLYSLLYDKRQIKHKEQYCVALREVVNHFTYV